MHPIMLFYHGLLLLFFLSAVACGANCPPGTEPIEGYFEYSLKINQYNDDACSNGTLKKMKESIDETIKDVEQTYTTNDGDAVDFLCSSDVYDLARNLRFDAHRRLGTYTRTGGGYCRRCYSSRRGLGGDKAKNQKNVEEVIVEEEQLLAEEEQLLDTIIQEEATSGQSATYREDYLIEFVKKVEDKMNEALELMLAEQYSCVSFGQVKATLTFLGEIDPC